MFQSIGNMDGGLIEKTYNIIHTECTTLEIDRTIISIQNVQLYIL